jgi:hypothetical protein
MTPGVGMAWSMGICVLTHSCLFKSDHENFNLIEWNYVTVKGDHRHPQLSNQFVPNYLTKQKRDKGYNCGRSYEKKKNYAKRSSVCILWIEPRWCV